MDDFYCPDCGELDGNTSHYHCSVCGERCSMMGHSACLERPAPTPAEVREELGSWRA